MASSSHPLDPRPPSRSNSAASEQIDSPLHTTIDIALSPPNERDDGDSGQGNLTSFFNSQPHRPKQPRYDTRGYSVDSFTSSTSGGARASSSTLDTDAATITPMLPHYHREAHPSSSSITLPRRGSSGSTTPEEEDGLGEDLDLNGTGRTSSALQWEESFSEEEDDNSDSDSPLEAPDSASSSAATETPAARRERRRRERRTFGGGRHRHGSRGQELEEEENEEGGERGTGNKGTGEVAGLVIGGSLSPTPLLLPLACARLGPALFVPLLALAGALGWLSAVVIGAEGRYVGARSFPALASAVFPHRLKLHLLGESLAVLFVLGGSIVRSTLDVVAAAEVAVDLFVPEHRRRDWEREVGVGVMCTVWLLVPLLLPPLLRLLSLDTLYYSLTSSTSSSSAPPARYSRLASTSSPDLSSTSPYPQGAYSAGPSPRDQAPRARWTALLRLPAWSVALITWPLALLILGVRLKRLNRDASSHTHTDASAVADLSSVLAKLPSHAFPNPTDPTTGATLWPAILLPFAALLGTAHETFYYFTSLARPSSTATARRSAAQRRGSSFSGGELPGAGGAGGVGTRKRDEAKRNQYPLAIAIGLFGSFLIHLGWALVGALGPHLSLSPNLDGDTPLPVLPAGNFLSDARLPRGDGWINLVRFLVLVGVLAQLEPHARLGVGRGTRAVAFFFPPQGSRAGGGGGRAGVKGWRKAVARVGVWAAVAGLAVLVVRIPRIAPGVGGGDEGGGGGGGGEGGEVGGHGSGLVYAVQWWAVVGGGLGACLGPALAYLTLFHLRPPRQIFVSPSTTHLSHSGTATTRDPSSSSPTSSTSAAQLQVDALLLRKERSIQRKLSGRRVWSDVGVFGALGPVGVVLVGRGVWALVLSAAGSGG
ncbi:hypothetical protein JCM11251_001971 [Rhodosporidiobolus azoricus]